MWKESPANAVKRYFGENLPRSLMQSTITARQSVLSRLAAGVRF